MRLIDRLRTAYPEASGRALKQWLASGRVRVDGVIVRRGDAAVESAARVALGLPVPAAAPLPFRIVHEDDAIVVIDKPAGLLTIATERERERTAYRLLGDHLAVRPVVSLERGRPSDPGRSRRPAGGRRRVPPVFVVHRLDRETSGLVCFARSVAAKRDLQAQFAARSVERTYVAVVEGVVREDSGTLAGRLLDRGPGPVRPTRDRRRGREAITRFRVLERRRETTLVEIALGTGRRAQIRAQLAALGHPIVGDGLYGSQRDPLGRLCLHATRLSFRHPHGPHVAFDSPMPPPFRRI